MKPRNLFAAAGFAAIALLLSSVSFAATKAQIDERVHVAMQQFYKLNPAHRELVGRAKGVLVFPHITKAGVGVGGREGHDEVLGARRQRPLGRRAVEHPLHLGAQARRERHREHRAVEDQVDVDDGTDRANQRPRASPPEAAVKRAPVR